MTQTLEPPAADSTAQDDVDDWLQGFEQALVDRDVERAAGMFAATSFWRDLIAFSWNITTVEDPAGVADLLRRHARDHRPVGLRHGRAADGRGRRDDGVDPLRDGRRPGSRAAAAGRRRTDGAPKAWTLLTTLYELKGHEEPLGRRRPPGAKHGVDPDRVTWAEQRQKEAEDLGTTTPAVRPGRRRRAGRHRPRRAAAAARRPEPGRSTSTRAPATSGAAATSRCACTTRSGTTTCRT